jgi:hypothetical protein
MKECGIKARHDGIDVDVPNSPALLRADAFKIADVREEAGALTQFQFVVVGGTTDVEPFNSQARAVQSSILRR